MDGEGAPASGSGLLARLRAMLGDSSDASLTKRLAGTIFIIRVLSAGLAYFSQVLLARWMGTSEYGIYVYAWTWVLLLGSMMDFGIADHGAETDPGISRQEPAQPAARLPVRQPLADFRRVRRHLMPARRPRLPAVAVDRGAYGHFALYRLHDPARAGACQRPGRHRALARLDAACAVAAVRRPAVADHRLHRRRVCARAPGSMPIDAMKFSSAAVWIAMIGQMVFLNRRLKEARRAGAAPLRLQKLACDLAADPAGRRLLPAAELRRHSGAAGVSSVRRRRHLPRHRQDAGAGVVHPLRDGGDHRAPLQRIPCGRRSRAAVGLSRARDQMDVLAVAGGDRAAARLRQAAAVAVRPAIHLRLSRRCSSSRSA